MSKFKEFSQFGTQFMLDRGYVHESVIEELTGTTDRTRARWTDLKGVMFGNERWYPVKAVDKLLAEKVADKGDVSGPVVGVL